MSRSPQAGPRVVLACLVLLLGTLAGAVEPARAQVTAAQPATALTAQQAQQAIAVLRDDAKRAEVLAVLEAIARTAPAIAGPAGTPAAAQVGASGSPGGPAAGSASAPHPATPAAPAPAQANKLPIPLAPNSLGAQLLVTASTRLQLLASGLSDTVRTLTNFGLLSRWATTVAEDPTSRAEIEDASWKLGVVALLGLATEWVLLRLLRGVRRALLLSAPAGTSVPPGTPHRRRTAAMLMLRRVPFMLGRLALELLPLLIGAALGYALLGTKLGAEDTTRLVILALLNAYILCRVVMAISRAVLSPDISGLRLFALSDEMAAFLVRWLRRLSVVALFGYAAAEVALLFGLYRVAHDALLKLVALAVHMMLLVMVLQLRAPVRRAIRAPEGTTGLVAALRNWVAPVWHFIAIFYIVALWLVWAFEVEGGFARLIRVFIATVIIVNLGRLTAVALLAGLDHLLTIKPGSARRYPGLDDVARRYLPALRMVCEVTVAILAGILLLEAWGLDSLSWFVAGTLGSRLVSAIITIAFTLVVALLVWEAANAAIQNHLARLTREAQAAKSARLRTLLPMLRTALLVAIGLFAGLTILSQIGVNIAPLLAGAGVVGLAVGFGSQKLVQDIITGLFLLLENTMQVGDVVTLGGLTGTVENLSIRTIRLRALDGSVHIVPFSAVTTVTNMTRDFAYALLDVSIGLNEEPDRIAQVLREVADEMRRETRWDAAISDGIEIMGVEKFIDTAWVLRCRVKTVPSQRWAVSRELNRRIKLRFDRDKIESPFTSYRALSAPNPDPPNAKTPEEVTTTQAA